MFRLRKRERHRKTDPRFDTVGKNGLTDRVHARQPYAAKGRRTLRNPGDGIYRRGGSQLVLNVTPAGEGYATAFDIALQNV